MHYKYYAYTFYIIPYGIYTESIQNVYRKSEFAIDFVPGMYC
jgi:hypothetical protein